jgi:hypothetical protein
VARKTLPRTRPAQHGAAAPLAPLPGDELMARELRRVLALIQITHKCCRAADRRRFPAALREAAATNKRAVDAYRVALDIVRFAGDEPTAEAWSALAMAAMLAGVACGEAMAHTAKAEGNSRRNNARILERRAAIDALVQSPPQTLADLEAIAEKLAMEPESVSRAIRRGKGRTQ